MFRSEALYNLGKRQEAVRVMKRVDNVFGEFSAAHYYLGIYEGEPEKVPYGCEMPQECQLAIVRGIKQITDGGELTTLAFGQIPYFGPFILVVGIITFAYSTILGWAYYGERCVEYFSGKWGLIPYKVLYIAVALIAPVLALDLVWKIADILNALMAIPNLIAVLLLSPVIVKETKKYVNDLDAVDDTPVPVVKTGIRGE